jgi:hypothetical protein
MPCCALTGTVGRYYHSFEQCCNNLLPPESQVPFHGLDDKLLNTETKGTFKCMNAQSGTAQVPSARGIQQQLQQQRSDLSFFLHIDLNNWKVNSPTAPIPSKMLHDL